MNRRSFIRGCLAAGVATSFGGGLVSRALAAHGGAHAGTSPWGPPDHFVDFGEGHGLWVPTGFDARIVGRAGQPVAGTSYPWHALPDGAHCFATGDGGWILVSNSEVPLIPTTGGLGVPNPGGVGAIRFAADGTIVDAYPVLVGTKVNCAGGPTPWGTWLSCEEWDGGGVWECDPAGLGAGSEPRRLEGMGSFAHEAAAVDPVGRRVFLSEDEKDGLLYRFTPAAWPDLSTGLLEAAEVGPDGTVAWHAVPEPNPTAFDYQDDWMGRFRDPATYPQGTPTRHQVPGATRFNGGEGCWYHDGLVHLTTKGDHRVWRLDVATTPNRMTVIHDPVATPGSTLRGVDTVVVHAGTGDIFVAEDGDDMEVQVITDDTTGLTVAPVVRMVGPNHTRPVRVLPDPADALDRSEVTGLAFSPDGRHFYCSSQRYDGFGITYEISGPWNEPASS